MIGRFLAGVAMVAVLASPVSAGEAGVRGVVELFTSQGCSSCPPADAHFRDLSTRTDIVALAFHVDYWDYLGWKDTLANGANTERQNGYARSFRAGSVYTPQAVVNGRVHVNGADRDAIDGRLADLSTGAGALSVPVRLSRQGDRVIAETGAGPAPAGEAVIVFAWFKIEAAVKVDHGENRGETIRYANSVMALTTTGMYHGEAGRHEMPVSEAAKAGADGCAVLVQEIGAGGAPGAILGAAQIKL